MEICRLIPGGSVRRYHESKSDPDRKRKRQLGSTYKVRLCRYNIKVCPANLEPEQMCYENDRKAAEDSHKTDLEKVQSRTKRDS